MQTVPKQQGLSPVTLTHIIYGLYILGPFIWFLPVVAVIINYIKQDDVRNTWLATHFDWQIKTFWRTLIWWAVGLLTAVIGVGVVILIVLFVWYLYRIVKGWVALSDGLSIHETA